MSDFVILVLVFVVGLPIMLGAAWVINKLMDAACSQNDHEQRLTEYHKHFKETYPDLIAKHPEIYEEENNDN